mgnify:CR=1 FL=1
MGPHHPLPETVSTLRIAWLVNRIAEKVAEIRGHHLVIKSDLTLDTLHALPAFAHRESGYADILTHRIRHPLPDKRVTGRRSQKGWRRVYIAQEGRILSGREIVRARPALVTSVFDCHCDQHALDSEYLSQEFRCDRLTGRVLEFVFDTRVIAQLPEHVIPEDKCVWQKTGVLKNGGFAVLDIFDGI